MCVDGGENHYAMSRLTCARCKILPDKRNYDVCEDRDCSIISCGLMRIYRRNECLVLFVGYFSWFEFSMVRSKFTMQNRIFATRSFLAS